MTTKRNVRRVGVAAIMCALASVPLYYFYRNNLEYEWLFNLVAFFGMFLLVFRFAGPVCVTFFEKYSGLFESVPVEYTII